MIIWKQGFRGSISTRWVTSSNSETNINSSSPFRNVWRSFVEVWGCFRWWGRLRSTLKILLHLLVAVQELLEMKSNRQSISNTISWPKSVQILNSTTCKITAFYTSEGALTNSYKRVLEISWRTSRISGSAFGRVLVSLLELRIPRLCTGSLNNWGDQRKLSLSPFTRQKNWVRTRQERSADLIFFPV